MTCDLTNPMFHNEDAARVHFEAIRWPDGKPVCPHCGVIGQATLIKGKSHRPGMYQCNACVKPFTVTIGTVMESSHVPLHKWALAFHLMASSKKGYSAHQLMRTLGLGSYRTAWFMSHRIREAMKANADESGPLGGEGKIVEADETYHGKTGVQPTETTKGKPFTKGGKTGPSGKRAVVALVERGGKARSFHAAKADAKTVREILLANISRKSALHTDESRLYTKTGAEFAAHETVNHSQSEYVRGEVHSNVAYPVVPGSSKYGMAT